MTVERASTAVGGEGERSEGDRKAGLPAPVALSPVDMMIEQARQRGVAAFVVERVGDLVEVAKATGFSREELIWSLITRVMALCRADPAARRALATVMAEAAQELDPEAVERVSRRAGAEW